MLIFWEKGFDGSSLADLTTAMGINAPSLYAAFGSKEELYLEALTLYAGEVGIEIWSTLDETPDVRAAFERFLLATIDAYCEESVPRGCMIALDALHRTHSSDKVCDVLRNHRQTNIEILKSGSNAAFVTAIFPHPSIAKRLRPLRDSPERHVHSRTRWRNAARSHRNGTGRHGRLGETCSHRNIIRQPALIADRHQDNPLPGTPLQHSQ